MKLIRYQNNPWSIFRTLEEEFDRLFDGLGLVKWSNLAGELGVSVDISEDKNNLYVEADLPGFTQKDINILLKEDVLSISGKKEESKEDKAKSFIRTERISRNFCREVKLPKKVNASGVKASYNNGVLKLTLPKKQEAKEKETRIDFE